jgi:subtilisin family serine protease
VSNRGRAASLLAIVLLLFGALPVAAAAPAGAARQALDAAAHRDRLIVTWRGLPPSASAIGLDSVRSSEPMAMPLRSVVRARPGGAADLAARLRLDPRVLLVVPDARLELSDWPADGAPDDPRFPDQPNLAQAGVTGAWPTTVGDPSVVVAVIDSGVDLAHPELDGVPVVAPQNVVWNNVDVTDMVGHGTWVTGTILAETDNATGIAGIAPAATLMPIKIADDDGFISFADALDAVDWARTHGADIVNMSFGGTLSFEQVQLGQPTFTAAREAGILLVAASGNDGIVLRNYPASFRGVVSVGAVDGDDVIAEFSTAGKALDVVAPGVDLVGPVPDGGYDLGSGTSGASPHVAGIAALVLAARPGLAVDELEAVIRASSVDLGDPGWDPIHGDGRVDAAAALAEPVPDPIPDLDPPAPLPELTITFLAPAAAVTQSGSTYTVLLETNHEVSDAFALLGVWDYDAGRCSYRDGAIDVRDLVFAPAIELTGLRQGNCYRVLAVAIDEDGNFAEAFSRVIRVVDPVVPRVVLRRPVPGATGVDCGANIRIGFSEPVRYGPSDIRLRNLETGLTVRATLRWDRGTDTLVIDPALRMYPRTMYQVEIGARVQDRKGNPVGAQSWVFRTGR